MLESENQYVGPVFGFFCDRAERNISFFYFPVFHFKRISFLHKAMLLVGFSRFACVSDAHVTPGVGSQVFLADAQSYHPHCVAHVHFYAGMYGEFAVCFFAVDQHVHAQVTGIDVSVYLPDRLSDSFFQLLEFVSEVFNKEAFQICLFAQYISGISSFLFRSEYGKPFIAYVPVSV